MSVSPWIARLLLLLGCALYLLMGRVTAWVSAETWDPWSLRLVVALSSFLVALGSLAWRRLEERLSGALFLMLLLGASHIALLAGANRLDTQFAFGLGIAYFLVTTFAPHRRALAAGTVAMAAEIPLVAAFSGVARPEVAVFAASETFLLLAAALLAWQRLLVHEAVAERDRRLREAGERQRALAELVQASDDLICLADHAGRLLFTNRGVEAIAGEGVPSSLFELHDPASGWILLDEVLPAVARGEHWHGELVLRALGGREPVEVEADVFPLRRGTETVLGSVERDISARKQLDRMKDEFIATVSHELRTPLTSILGSLRLLESQVAGELPEAVKAMLRIALANTGRLVRLVNDVLDVERLQAGRLELRRERVDPRGLVAEAVDAVRGLAVPAGLRLRTEVEGVPQVDGDPDRLVLVLTNLLSNAVKVSPEGGRIVVAAARRGDAVRFEVTDEGPGIMEEDQERIFERFRQLDGTAARRLGGSGLGLAIARGIVEQHGGRIGVRSRPGEGATFWFELPV